MLTSIHVRKVRLDVVSGPGEGTCVVSERERIRIGADESCLLTIDDPTISREHAEVQFTDRGYLLVDLDSTNGTTLDGKRIERAYLSPGSTIGIGSTVITFSQVDEEIRVEVDETGELGEMIGESTQMRQLFGLIRKIAPMDVTLLITGETGTGKDLVSRAVHELSDRRKKPFVVLDCAAIPPNLIESEIFGHEKGSFTGADRARIGAFERADGGTIFLDELGELRLDLQPRLLRVLETREVRRVGGEKVRRVDVRVLAATNRDLGKEIQAGNFREDLFFRLSVINIALPSLRERRDDIPVLAERFLNDPTVVARHGRKVFSEAAMNLLVTYDWPGNIRELLNLVQQMVTLFDGDVIGVDALPPRFSTGEQSGSPMLLDSGVSFKEAKESLLSNFEREYISNILRACDGNISEAARRSGLHRKSIERLAKKYSLDAKSLGKG